MLRLKEGNAFIFCCSRVENYLNRGEGLSLRVVYLSDEEELSFDLRKIKKSIKKIFKRENKGAEETKEKGEEEIDLDLKKGADFLKKNSKWLIPAVLILIAVFFSVFLRMQSSNLPITDDWARDTVYSHYKNNIEASVNQEYPNLPQENKQALVRDQFQKLLEQQGSQIEEQIEATSNSFKEQMKDEDGNTYLLAIDPYYYMRHVRHYLENGQAGTTYVGGEYGVSDDIKLYHNDMNFNKKRDWDGQRLAPIGSPSKMTFHAYFTAYLYKVVSFFNSGASVMGVMFLVPVIIAALAVLPAFFIGKKIGGNVGGFFAAMMIAVHSSFLNRTAGGFSDTDAYNVLFPLLAVWFFLEAFETDDWKKKISLGGLSGLSIGLFAFAWSGWWFIFDFILGAAGIYLIYNVVINWKGAGKLKLLLKKKRIKNTLMILVVFFVFSGLFVGLFAGLDKFVGAPLEPLRKVQTLKIVGVSIWPNIQTTVAELNEISLNKVINQIGGGLLFALAFLGAILTLTKKDKKGERYIKHFLILLLWLVGTTYMSTKGIRFLLLLVPAFAVSFGAAAGIIYEYGYKWLKENINLNKTLAQAAVIAILALTLIAPVKSSFNTAKHEIPSMNDAWYDTLEEIKLKSSEEAIINSWWDFGHWFITLADRRVTFDGGGQDKHMAYWIGKSLLTNSEEKAKGILRMVDCGNNNAFWALDGILNDTPKSIDILNEVIVLDKEEARNVLEKYVGGEGANLVLRYTHCQAPENYYITSEDMVGKSGVWAHFGSWDFEKSFIYSKLRKKTREEAVEVMKEKFNYSEEKAEDLYFEVQGITSSSQANNWIAPWPSYAGQVNCQKEGEMLGCGSGVNVNLSNYEAWIQGSEGKQYFKRVAVPEGEDVLIKESDGPWAMSNRNRPIGLVLIPQGESYRGVLMDDDLVGSTFTRLFYLRGHGMKYFDLFSERRQFTGGNIYVWKVDWSGEDKNNVYEAVNESVSEEEMVNMMEGNLTDVENVSD